MHAPIAVRQSSPARQVNKELTIAPSLERRRLQCYLAQIIADLAGLLSGFAILGYLYLGPDRIADALITGQVLAPIFLTVALYNGTYSIDSLRNIGRGISKALLALALSAFAIVLIGFLTKSGAQFSRFAFTAGVGLSGLFLIWSRLQMRSFVTWRCGANVMNELVLNDGGPSINLPGAIEISASELQLVPDLNDPDAMHRVGLALRHIDRVVVSCPLEKRAAWAMALKGANVTGEVLDEQVVQLGAQGARVIGDQGALLVSAGPLGLRSRAMKRIFDMFCAAGALVLLSPVLLLTALAIKLEDGGPVLFVQKRVGRGNRFFQMYKFRSMSVGRSDKDAAVLTMRDDDRLTRIGQFIRRTSIDELPQLFNVLLGDMSLVGPRPHAVGALAGDKLYWEVDLRYWHRHSLKPGLSGLAQIRGFRGSTDHERDLLDRLQSDLEYLEGWTILRDIQIIFLTLRVLVHDKAF
ncbi:MAG: sugar transferase [Sphingomonadaceae bacterium]|nr:sugar transferase [Sphingomonadaceae bacterium]